MTLELQDITPQELKSFIEAYFSGNVFAEELQREAIFIKGVRIGNKLAGIGGLLMHYHFFPFSFYFVKPEFRGRGVGNELTNSIVKFAKKKRFCLFFAVVSKNNTPSIIMHQRRGHMIFYTTDKYYFMLFPLNKAGEIMGKYFMPVIANIYLLLPHWLRKYESHDEKTR
ncbi:MAG: GNAT family N-acetyltransferase [Thermoplasmatales archaeon]|nr:GNAT family N-acetyltransferase [Thermoplasmatales archaeon]